MNLSLLHDLASEWRAEAAILRRRGASVLAEALESCAADLEARISAWELEELTMEEAAEESGYSYSTIQQKVGKGELPNAGSRGSPRIRRRDLPSRGVRRKPQSTGAEPDLAAGILARKLSVG